MIIKLRGGKNFRDLGGIKNKDGKTVKEGLFIRGGHLAKLTENDISVLSAFSPKTIIDLRTIEEEKERPDREIPGCELVKKPLFSSETAGLSREKGSSLETIVRNCRGKAELLDAIPDLAAVYPLMAHSSEPLEAIPEIMNTIITNAICGRATIYHCTAGKDRTGVVSLLILTALKVPFETIMHDYLLTNKFVRGEANKIYLGILLKSRSFKVARKLRDCIVARRRYMISFVDEINKKYGSVENFITNGLGIGSELIEQFREASLA